MAILDTLKRLKVAIYIRVSTHWQIDKDSLQVQRRELIAYAQMLLGIQEYEVFEDAGYSAKNTDRPKYQEMMARLRTGEFTHLLVWKIDRISRNLLDFASMYEELKRLGVDFISKNEKFDTGSAIGEAMLKIILVFAELERNMTSERVTGVMLSRAANGQWNGGRIPYGYDYNKETKAFSFNPQERKVVQRMYDLYEREQSLLAVCQYFNDHQIYARSGKPWTPSTLRKILTNIFYIGHYRYNATHQGGPTWEKRGEDEWVIVEDHHIAMIDEIQFERVGFLLKRNRRGGVPEGATYVRKNSHVFAGLVRCGSCGSNMSATLDKVRADGWQPSIYGCSKRRQSKVACQNKFISDVTLGPFVFNYIANIIRVKDSITPRTDLKVLEKKLLNGIPFTKVAAIDPESLSQLRNLLLSGSTGIEYRPSGVFRMDETINERDLLLSQKRKHENAMNRLKSLYLYGNEDLPEKDYIMERQRIMSEIEEIDRKLSTMAADDTEGPLADDEFIEKASYFIMVQNLLNDKSVDYEKYIRRIEPAIPRAFIRTIIDSIDTVNGRVSSIQFKNGMIHKFIYED